MKSLQQFANLLLCLALAAAVGAGAWWLVTHETAAAKAEKPASPAAVAKVVKEEELNAVVLTEGAEKRLGVMLGAVQKKALPRTRLYGGEVTIPIGKTVLVAAPLAGTLKAPAGGMPPAGQAVKRGQAVVELLPLLTPEGRTTLASALVDADGQVKNAQTQVDATRIALDRASRLLREEAGSQRLVDEAQAAFDLAAKTHEAAVARRKLLAQVVGEAEGGATAPLPLAAPAAGLLRAVTAFPGQTVPNGAPLFEVVDLSSVWVRVALPVGDLDEIDAAGVASVGKLSDAAGASRSPAQPVAAPPSANPIASTVDLYYQAPNEQGRLTPGQRVGVTLPLKEAAESLTVPWSAVVFDMHGGAWVYERTAPRTYVRRRVALRHAAGPDAVLASGPPAGTPVVSAGALELFAAETGYSK